ncbi:penicillin acylase family protein [Duganella sp. FT3S]|uniref:Penicillin acylase family protein n=1 Tax=Rugamonas fusca TaxID=2758568 RepID=A0A7W2EEM6_9BURK|nr:penicillin acylase family protein [Rugamonas fusca]MBA5604500.1 penicillin acylase family protein [Rugamonas fusca]
MQKSRLRVWTGRAALGAAGLVAASALGGWLYLRASMAQLDGELHAPALHAQVSVARDAHGVPLISGADRLDVAYATGFVHAQDRYFQMDLLRRVAAGELSELFGARALGVDRTHRLHRFRARATLALQGMPAGQRALLDRYVAGVNAGLQGLHARPFEYALIGMAPRPWSPEDTLLVIWAMYFDLQGGQEARELARGWLLAHTDAAQRAFLAPAASQWDAPLDADQLALADAPIPAAAPAWWGKPRAPGAPQTASVAFLDMVGSNNWAVAGSRSADGGAIVSDDMHLGIQLPNTWYRAALQFPDAGGGQRRVVGVTLPGTPAVVVGSNGHVAWGFTNSYGDYLDLIALDTDGAHPGQVRTQAGWETPVLHEETILVKGAPADKLAVRETSLGPIRAVAGRQYAVHWTAHTAAAINFNALQLESANSVQQALMIAPTLGIPAQNFVAGDDRGNIGWTIAGPLPRRAATGEAATYPLAAADAAGVWQGWLAPADYPRVFNPAGGQLATANSRQLAGAGAELIGDGGFDLGARTRQVRDDLRALGAKTGVPQVYAVGLDDRAVFMEGWRERAIKALMADNGKAVAGHVQRAEALRLLKDNWTGHASVDSAGYRIARGYMHALYDIVFEHANDELAKLDPKSNMAAVTQRWPVALARLLDAQPAAWLPAPYASWQEVQLAAIDRVTADLTKDGQPLAAATWGQRNTAASAHPFASAVPLLGRWLRVPADMLPGDSNMPRVAGPTFGQSERLTVTPGKEEQGIFNMPGGQSGHPLSPYFLDGRADWVAGRQTPLLPGPTAHTLTFVR